MKRTKIIPFIAILAFTACASQTPLQQQNSQAALVSVIAAATAYASGNDVAAAVNGIQGASYFIRSLQSTPNAANPDAVVAAVTEGTVATPTKASPALTSLGTTVANAVTALKANGLPPNSANEAAAIALDQAAAQIKAPTQASAKLPTNWISKEGFPHLCHAYGVTIDPAVFKRLTFAADPRSINIRP